jgi:hypothetical protein
MSKFSDMSSDPEKRKLLNKEPDAVADRMYKAGVKPSFSTGICKRLTAGYGKLDQHGYFQYPLMPAEVYLKELNNGAN